MKVEKDIEILGEEWRLSFQSFTHSLDINIRCRFYMTRHHDFKSIEFRILKKNVPWRNALFLYCQNSLVTLYPESVKGVKVEILKFLTGYVNN